MGSRAFSHDSIFISEVSEEDGSSVRVMSEESTSGKVKSIQRQIAHNIKFGHKPVSAAVRKVEEFGDSSEDEEHPRCVIQVVADVEVNPSDTLTKGALLRSPMPKRALSLGGTIESINLDAVPFSVSRLDNAAAKHKLSVKPKNQRISKKHRRLTLVNKMETKERQHNHLQEQKQHLLIEHKEKKAEGYNENAQMLKDAEQQQKWEQRKQMLDVQRHQEMEEDQLRKADQQMKQEFEKQRRQEAEEETQQDLAKERQDVENQRKLKVEVQRQQEIKEQKKKEQKMQEVEEHKKKEIKEQRRKEQDFEEKKKKEAEEKNKKELEEQRQQELEEKRKREAEEQKKRELEHQRQRDLEEQKKREDEEKKKELEEHRKLDLEAKGSGRQKKKDRENWRKRGCRRFDPQEQERRREELRWQDMEERHAAPRPFTFKVTSGEKQIIFQKVNLTPVTPVNHHSNPSDQKESKSLSGAKGAHSLPSSLYIPHTAILVTGAQLCGTAVNMDQIKDTACKSLLGLSEDKKTLDLPPVNSRSEMSPEGKPSTIKSRSLHEGNQSSAAILAEWAMIRSRILKSADNGKLHERDSRHQVRHATEDCSQKGITSPHTSLRKTMSASAKFSITPAWQKFPDNATKTRTLSLDLDSADSSPCKAKERSIQAPKSTKTPDSTEGYVFAKDLPSFLVPSPPHGSQKGRSLSETQTPQENQESAEKRVSSSEEKVSPFGIKLRRTNYSLRYHSEQQAEQKRKKRYSAGDNFEGIPAPLLPIGHEKSTLSTKGTAVGSLKDTTDNNATGPEARLTLSKINIPAIHGESERHLLKPTAYQKPCLAPKPSCATPPSSPLDKSEKSKIVESQRTVKEGLAPLKKKDDVKEDTLPVSSQRKKPTLQSRHSLDSSRLPEKGESSQPLWITLALQKQRGFREQQSTREERRQAREAKLAEKQAKENVCFMYLRASSDQAPQKPTTQTEEKKPESLLSRFERREQLRKSNTLPNSVTVEIADSSSPSPKDVPKRFPPSESAQVTTEPAWLALAKRKAKAWSDCPQIIK
uniref:Capping protein inhibiting regulator of actin dynamics n=1 Tax=Erpetoichthys calabaricus TaxID=27687 RepID=A0A8C4SI04_ERPCA